MKSKKTLMERAEVILNATSGLGSTILDRGRAKLRAKPVTDLATPMLKGIIDVGCAIYGCCLKVTQRGFIHKPALALYRHVLEMTDSIQVLIADSCAEPTVIPASRSALEAAMSLIYLLDKDYEHRSLVWSYYNLRKTKKLYGEEKFKDSESEVLKRINRQIKSKAYTVLHKRLKDSKVPNNWFQWVLEDGENGPSDLRDLSIKLTEKRRNLGKKSLIWKEYT